MYIYNIVKDTQFLDNECYIYKTRHRRDDKNTKIYKGQEILQRHDPQCHEMTRPIEDEWNIMQLAYRIKNNCSCADFI